MTEHFVVMFKITYRRTKLHESVLQNKKNICDEGVGIFNWLNVQVKNPLNFINKTCLT